MYCLEKGAISYLNKYDVYGSIDLSFFKRYILTVSLVELYHAETELTQI